MATKNSISGNFNLSDTAGITSWLNTNRDSVSGAAVFVIPGAGNLDCKIGVSHQ